jgi:hypothetical protein
MLRARRLFGHDAIEPHLAAAEIAVRRVELREPRERSEAVVAARRACRHALQQSRIVSSGRPGPCARSRT